MWRGCFWIWRQVGYKEGAPGNSGAMEGEPSRGTSFRWLPVPNTICLVGSLLGHTTIPYLRQSSFISLRRKFGHRGSLSISLAFCRSSLAEGWYCNLSSHHQASVPCPPEGTMDTKGHKRILSNFSLELEDQTASSYQGCISRASIWKWIGYFPSEKVMTGRKRKKKKT